MLAQVVAVTLAISGFLCAQSEPARLNHVAPLSIAREGYVFAGGKYSPLDGRQAMSGQLFAEFQISSKMVHPYPIVMIHGGGQTGPSFTVSRNGRDGSALVYLHQRLRLYCMCRP